MSFNKATHPAWVGNVQDAHGKPLTQKLLKRVFNKIKRDNKKRERDTQKYKDCPFCREFIMHMNHQAMLLHHAYQHIRSFDPDIAKLKPKRQRKVK